MIQIATQCPTNLLTNLAFYQENAQGFFISKIISTPRKIMFQVRTDQILVKLLVFIPFRSKSLTASRENFAQAIYLYFQKVTKSYLLAVEMKNHK